MAIKIFYGGGVNIADLMRKYNRPPFDNIAAMSEADLRVANPIEVSFGIDEPAPVRIRPKEIDVLIDEKPVLVRVADLNVAILPVDVADENFSSKASNLIADIRNKADAIFVAVDWKLNADKFFDQMREIGRALIDCGADGVLGHHARVRLRVENYKERPIIYGAGILLSNERGEKDSAGYLLTVERDGVKRVEFTALRRREGYTVPATVSKNRINKAFFANAEKLGTVAKLNEDGSIPIEFAPPPRAVGYRKPLTEPRPEWTVERVPEDAVIRPEHFGALTLLGYRCEPSVVTRREPIAVETFWAIDRPLDRSYQLLLRAEPERECVMRTWGDEFAHEFFDWQFPTDRWTPGIIYRERIVIEPPRGELADIDLQLEIEIFDGAQSLGKYTTPPVIEMSLPNAIRVKKKYPSGIYDLHLDQLWTPQQIVDITDGEWIVPPPEGFFFRSVICKYSFTKKAFMKPPLLFAPPDKFWRSSKWDGELPPKVGGLIVTERRDDVPPELPQLKVPNPYNAVCQLGIANRRRFRGRLIAVTGSSGKTTTTSMISHVLSGTMKCLRTFGNRNIDWVPIIFANVFPNTAFAIIEMASSAFEMSRGSVACDITPDIAVVTSLSAAHIARHGSMEGVAEVKSKIFCGMSPGSYVILNRDMPLYEVFERKAKEAALNIITFGTHPEATIRMRTIANGAKFTVGGKRYTVECDVPAVQIYDVLATVGVSIAAGFSINETLQRLKSFKPVSGRGNIIKIIRDGKALRIINSTYNANVGSMSADLKYLNKLETDGSHRVAVLGDIAELGEESIERHRQLAPAVVGAAADRVLLCGEYMKYLWEDIKDKVNATYFPTLKELLAELDDCLKDGDTILVKSSHSTHLDQVVKYLNEGAHVSD